MALSRTGFGPYKTPRGHAIAQNFVDWTVTGPAMEIHASRYASSAPGLCGMATRRPRGISRFSSYIGVSQTVARPGFAAGALHLQHRAGSEVRVVETHDGDAATLEGRPGT